MIKGQVGAPTVKAVIDLPRKVRIKCIAAIADDTGNITHAIYWGKDENRADKYKGDKPFLNKRINPYWTSMVNDMFKKW